MARKHPKVSSGRVPLQKGGENNGTQAPTGGQPSLTERDGAWEHHPVVGDRSTRGSQEVGVEQQSCKQTEGAYSRGQLGRTQEEGSGVLDTTELKAGCPDLEANQIPSPPSFILM